MRHKIELTPEIETYLKKNWRTKTMTDLSLNLPNGMEVSEKKVRCWLQELGISKAKNKPIRDVGEGAESEEELELELEIQNN